MHSLFRVTGQVHVRVWDSNLRLKDERVTRNLVVLTGRQHIANQLGVTPSPDAAMSHIAYGTDAIAASSGDTSLGVEVYRQALDGTYPITSGNQITYRISVIAGSGTEPAIVEAGIFNDVTVGSMLARSTFSAIAKGVGDSLTIDWTVSIDAP